MRDRRVIRVIPVRGEPSPRLLRACAPFGLVVTRSHAMPHAAFADRTARSLLSRVKAGQIALIVGPSGCGKSSVLRAIARRVRVPRTPRFAQRPIIDLVPGSLPERLSILSRAGLADAALLARRPDELSEGERHRLLLALLLSRAPRGSCVLIDEFTSPLDRATAFGVATTLARWARSASLRLVIATPHADLLKPLNPDALLELSVHAETARLRWRRGDLIGDETHGDMPRARRRNRGGNSRRL